MKKLIYKAFILISLIIAVDLILGTILSKMYFHVKSGTIYKVNYAFRSCNDDILLMGASETYHHLISNRIKDSLGLSCYNFGIDGEKIVYQYTLFEQIVKRHKPKILILSFTTIEDQEGATTVTSLLPYCKDYSDVKETVIENVPSEKYKLLSKTYPYNSLLFKIIQGNIAAEPKTNGYLPLTGTNPYLKLVTNPDKIEKTSRSINYFIKLIELAKRSGCRVYIFQAPRYEINSSREDQQLYTSICNTHNVTPLNYLSDTTFLNHRQYFRDHSHLNNPAAEILTDKIIVRLRDDLKNK